MYLPHGVTTLKFYQMLWHEKTRVRTLLCSTDCLTIDQFGRLNTYLRVPETRTD